MRVTKVEIWDDDIDQYISQVELIWEGVTINKALRGAVLLPDRYILMITGILI
jgi:hypothetical protein